MADMLPLIQPDVLPVTGIINLDPPTVQCQACAESFSYPRLDPPLLNYTTKLHHAHGGLPVRYCRPCFAALDCDCRQHQDRW